MTALELPPANQRGRRKAAKCFVVAGVCLMAQIALTTSAPNPYTIANTVIGALLTGL